MNSSPSTHIRRCFSTSDGNLNRKYDPFGLNALHDAAGTCSLEKTRLLLDADVGVNVKDDRGNTALMLVVAEGDEEMIRLLLFGIETTDKSVG